jgi:hypothetical protein
MTLPNGRGSREYGKFAETLRGETAVAVMNLDESIVETFNITDSGDTEILASPGEEKSRRIMGIQISNADSSSVTVSLKAGSDGDTLFTHSLAAKGNVDINLVGRHWKLTVNQPLYVNLDGSGNVYVTIQYVGALAAQEVETLSDSLTIAEQLANTITLSLSESENISESINIPA